MSDRSDHLTIRQRLTGRPRRVHTDDDDNARLRDTVSSTEDAIHHALGPVVDVEQSLAAFKQRLKQDPSPTDGETPFKTSILDRIPALVALFYGPEHRLTYVNDAYVTAFGTRPLGEPAYEVLPELNELGLLALFDQVLRSGKPRTLKSRTARDGRSYTFTCTPVADGDGVMVFATDVTDHVEAAERLQRTPPTSNSRNPPAVLASPGAGTAG